MRTTAAFAASSSSSNAAAEENPVALAIVAVLSQKAAEEFRDVPIRTRGRRRQASVRQPIKGRSTGAAKAKSEVKMRSAGAGIG